MKEIIKIIKLTRAFRFFWILPVLLTFSLTAVKAQLDTTFGINGVAVANPQSPAQGRNKSINSFLLPDGKILIVNEFSATNEAIASQYYFIRFNANGTLDSTYGINGFVQIQFPVFHTGIVSAARQTDGKILLAGGNSIMRYNENGTLDTTFRGTGFHTPNVEPQSIQQVKAVVQQSDGKILLAGNILSPAPDFAPVKIFFVRYELNGSFDTTFGDQGGFIVNNVLYASLGEIALQSDGRILTVPQRQRNQNNTFYNGTISRFNANGTVDSSFTPIYFNGGTLQSFKLLRNDSFLVAGNKTINDHLLRTHKNIILRRYTPYGYQDKTFGKGGFVQFDVASAMSDEPISLGEQADGKIIVGGVTEVMPNRSATRGSTLSLIRLTSHGTLDGKYLVANLSNVHQEYTAEPSIYNGQILVQRDGKILTVSNHLQNGNLLLTRSTDVPYQVGRFHGIPYSFLGMNFAYPGVYRPNNRNWYFTQGTNPIFFGLTNDTLAPADYIGDFRADIAVFRSSEGNWYIAKEFFNPAQNFVIVHWGRVGDIPIPRDYDGDSKADIAVFRPENGFWYIRNSADSEPRLEIWGMSGDKPVADDYDGDGFADIAVWRPSNGTWYISQSSDGQTVMRHFGMEGDIPVQDDYDGDGKADIAVFRPSNGNWYILKSSDDSLSVSNLGIAGDIPIPADYDGDRRTDIGVWRPSNFNWFINYSSDNSLEKFAFGLFNDIPTQGRN